MNAFTFVHGRCIAFTTIISHTELRVLLFAAVLVPAIIDSEEQGMDYGLWGLAYSSRFRF